MASKIARKKTGKIDPLVCVISGPDALVGPALVYHGEAISVMVAHGRVGTPGELTEVILGTLVDDVPEWAQACDTVIEIRSVGEMTLAEAQDCRNDIVRRLRADLRHVEAHDSDLALATANAEKFPSEESRRVLGCIVAELGG